MIKIWFIAQLDCSAQKKVITLLWYMILVSWHKILTSRELRQEMVTYFWVVLQFTFGSSREGASFYRWGTYFFLNRHIWLWYITYM